MTKSHTFRRMLMLELDAVNKLEEEGYTAFRIAEPNLPITLFACREDCALYVTLKRAHRSHVTIEEVITVYAKEIRAYRQLPRVECFNFEIWVYAFESGGWQYYQVMPDQVSEVNHGG